MNFFASMGCSVSDHGLEYVMYAPASAETVESIFANVLVELHHKRGRNHFQNSILWFLLEKKYAKMKLGNAASLWMQT